MKISSKFNVEQIEQVFSDVMMLEVKVQTYIDASFKVLTRLKVASLQH